MAKRISTRIGKIPMPKPSELRAVLKAFPDLFFRLDSGGTILEYHAEALPNSGVLPQSCVGKQIRNVLTAEVADGVHDAVLRAKETGSVATFEYFLPLEGQKRRYEARVLPVLKNQFLVIVRNVTQQKSTEEALRVANERFELAASAVDSAIYDWDILSETLTWTDGITKVFGYPMEEVQQTDQWWIDHIHSEDRQRVLREISTDVTQARDYAVEYRFLARDQQYRVVLDRGLMVRNAGGRIVRVVGSIADITGRKLAEETLQLLIEIIATASEAEDPQMMTSRCLERICIIRGWQFGQAWFVDEQEHNLFCSHAFYAEIDVTNFRRESLQMRLPKGLGLPGKVWESDSPLWISDVGEDTSSIRASLAKQAGLKTAFALPIRSENKLLAIFEFFSAERRTPDQHFLRVGEKLGAHLGVVFERKREQEAIRHQAYHDVLTGLPNRTLFQDRFTQALARARRQNEVLAVLFLDLDRFKTINDTLGHSIGDQLLKEVAHRLAKSMREVDTIARMGGDEFTLLLPDIQQLEDVAKVAQKILSLFSAPFRVEKHELFTTTSIGISLFPHDGEDPQTLLKNSDVALYRAKEKGRNNYQLYTPAMTATALARLKIESDLRYALRSNQFLLHYQPQVQVQSGEILAVEALLRWQHPEMGLLLPAEFIPVAEDTGLIIPVWEWALHSACIQHSRWQHMRPEALPITMNISPLQFQQSSFVETVAATLKETRLPPDCLELEITENLVMRSDLATPVLGKLKDMGIRIAMDDFGTGYSSLSDLTKYPIDKIKIDPYFIRDLPNDSRNLAITETIISLGHGLGMTVVAESVETRQQLDCLRSIACDAVQGFLFCRPLPAATFTPLLLQRLALPDSE